MKVKKLLSAIVVGALVSQAVMADDKSSMSGPQKKAIETIIHDYLVKNPEVLIEASQALQQKQQQEAQQQAQAAILKNTSDLIKDEMTASGNASGNVTLVEFFDYQCIHCKKMAPVIGGLIKSNPNLRVIYKEFPIFGKSSELASKAALAAAMQGKYLPMHEALLKQDKPLSDVLVDEAAKTAGLDMSKFKSDMNSQKITDALAANRKLAEELHLMGTPAFIVISTPNGKFREGSIPAFIPGAASEQSLKDLIKKASAS